MTPTIPATSALYAALLGLLAAVVAIVVAAVLTVRVIVQRMKLAVTAGDGGRPGLAQAIRADANIAEPVPSAVLVLAGG